VIGIAVLVMKIATGGVEDVAPDDEKDSAAKALGKRGGAARVETRYNENLYDIALFDIVPVNGERLKAAARVGARKGLKLVEALHFAAAMESECAIFLTDDARIRSSDGIEVVTAASL